jgi:multidrug resistance efflux pump
LGEHHSTTADTHSNSDAVAISSRNAGRVAQLDVCLPDRVAEFVAGAVNFEALK